MQDRGSSHPLRLPRHRCGELYALIPKAAGGDQTKKAQEVLFESPRAQARRQAAVHERFGGEIFAPEANIALAKPRRSKAEMRLPSCLPQTSSLLSPPLRKGAHCAPFEARGRAPRGSAIFEADLAEVGAKRRCPGSGQRGLLAALEFDGLLPLHLRQQQANLPSSTALPLISPSDLGALIEADLADVGAKACLSPRHAFLPRPGPVPRSTFASSCPSFQARRPDHRAEGDAARAVVAGAGEARARKETVGETRRFRPAALERPRLASPRSI